jgi:hypothetical protein
VRAVRSLSWRARASVIAGTAVLSVGGMAVGLAAGASAASGTVTAVTHSAQHDDTTSNAGPCTVPTIQGPAWAYDNLSEQFKVTPEANPGNYSVTITTHGSFQAFADPNTGDCADFSGAVDGSIQYDVSSATPPDPGNLPAQEPPGTGLGAALSQLFDGQSAGSLIVGGGHYSFTYNRVDGGKYTQTG